MKRMIFIFVDGVGIGKPDEHNPFYFTKCDYLPFYEGSLTLPDGTPIKKIDALLGVEGIPQSASGQTSLFTGENIPKITGQHKDSYPTRTMREIIIEKNILSRLKQENLNAVFINAYPAHGDLFTEEHIKLYPSGEFHFSQEFPAAFKRRISATSCMMLAAHQKPFDESDIREERSIFQDYSNRWLIEKGMNIPEFSPEKAAEILFHASQRHDFILYEFFQTDLYGHRAPFEQQVQLVHGLNLLIKHLLSLMNPQTDTFLLTSDHGNIEDSQVRSHTLNPVPLITWGNQNQFLRDQINDLTHVTPTIVNSFF